MTDPVTLPVTGPASGTPSVRVRLPVALSGAPTSTARLISFDGLADAGEHLAVGLGDRAGVGPARAFEDPPLVRLHSECLTGDVLGSRRCDCGPQLRESVQRITEVGGYLLYLRQEGRGIGLYAKLDAYVLQDAGLDTYQANEALGYPADGRDYTVAAQMLLALGERRIRLLSNNPDKAEQLEALGVEVVERVPTGVHVSPTNRSYLLAKARRAHSLDLDVEGPR